MVSSQSEQKDGVPQSIYCSTLTDADIITYCSDPPPEALDAIPLGKYSNSVIPLSDQEVVKYGPRVYIEEYLNLQHAYRLLDSSIVRVPQPYRFFQNGTLDTSSWSI